MSILLTNEQIDFFNREGYLIVENLLSAEEVAYYRGLYEDFLDNKIDASRYRSDLGGHVTNDGSIKKERITQIMVPSRVVPELTEQPLHVKALSVAKALMGDDMDLDFDMLIDKAPHTNTPTPWHQDCSYWISMPDTRAVSCWVALDDAVKENGCMWYVPHSHTLPMRVHRPAGKGGGALECDADESEGIAVEIKPGTAVLHHGRTLHYSRGNSTDMRRRAFITNYRPAAMIEFEREQGYDHTGERKVRSKEEKKD